jgi:hypothetical protein
MTEQWRIFFSRHNHPARQLEFRFRVVAAVARRVFFADDSQALLLLESRLRGRLVVVA